ncbi:MAG: hypothetical protein EDM05_000515 [Leptolyngbya sp. IPPAS B-1204]
MQERPSGAPELTRYRDQSDCLDQRNAGAAAPCCLPMRLVTSTATGTRSVPPARKAVKHQLDSLDFAPHVAAHWRYWGSERNWVLGAETPECMPCEGYIVALAKAENSNSATATKAT